MYNEYPKDYFQIKHQDGIKRFYFRINNEDIEVSKEVFKACRRSQNKIQYNKKKQATQSIFVRKKLKSKNNNNEKSSDFGQNFLIFVLFR